MPRDYSTAFDGTPIPRNVGNKMAAGLAGFLSTKASVEMESERQLARTRKEKFQVEEELRIEEALSNPDNRWGTW